MCGLVAALRDEAPVSSERLAAAVRTIGHRGPDSSSQWVSANGRMALGHARLSIIDLATGDQPIANEDGPCGSSSTASSTTSSASRRDLRAGPPPPQPTPTARSPCTSTRTSARPACTSCAASSPSSSGTAATTRSSPPATASASSRCSTPHGGDVYLASEIKALFAAGVPARWDHDAFFRAAPCVRPQDRTLFDGIFTVPPGHFLIARGGAVGLIRYWDFDYPAADELGPIGAPTPSTPRVPRGAGRGGRQRLRADVPVGCYLSGGIDSCAVLGLARAPRRPIRAFTLTSTTRTTRGGDRPRMAEHAGADFHPVPVTQGDLADEFADAVWHAETLFINGTAWPSTC